MAKQGSQSAQTPNSQRGVAVLGGTGGTGREMDEITLARVRQRLRVPEQNLKAVPVPPGRAAVALTTG
jgi:hypothetical protein